MYNVCNNVLDWVSLVQAIILIVSMITYGLAPVGFDLHRKSSLVLVTSLSLQQMEIIQPANFWIGPSAVSQLTLYFYQICSLLV